MKVLIYGAGPFGKTTAMAFAEHPSAYEDVAITDPLISKLQSLPKGVRASHTPTSESPDIVVIAATSVPTHVRRSLVEQSASLEQFWALERTHNIGVMRTITSHLTDFPWRALIVESNPVHEWVNAFVDIWPERLVLGVGTAFDDRRLRFLAAAGSPKKEAEILNQLKVLGGHGCAIGVSGNRLDEHLIEAARWMSNVISRHFADAPQHLSQLWWLDVALRPLAQGLGGERTLTHVVTQVQIGSVRAATGIEVILKGLEVQPIIPKQLSADETSAIIAHLDDMRTRGHDLASALQSS